MINASFKCALGGVVLTPMPRQVAHSLPRGGETRVVAGRAGQARTLCNHFSASANFSACLVVQREIHDERPCVGWRVHWRGQ
jgi:hypothetical protein